MRVRPLLLPLIVLALIAPTCGGTDLGTETNGQEIGNETGYNAIEYEPGKRSPAPGWQGQDLHGALIASEAFDGSITVVNVWAAWCAPCRVEQPALVRVAKAYESKGVRFVGVNIRETTANALAFVEEFGVPYPSVHDPSSAIAFKFRIRFPPTTFVIDREGKIGWRITGETRESELAKILDQELAR
jgi:DsbE subfamily thiol:disulfide oxidoreductase